MGHALLVDERHLITYVRARAPQRTYTRASVRRMATRHIVYVFPLFDRILCGINCVHTVSVCVWHYAP